MLRRLFRLPKPFRHRARRTRLLTMLLVLLTLFAVLTPIYALYKPPYALILYFQHRWPDVLWHVPLRRTKMLALTIDDAPSAHTRDILRVLRANGAAATFFVIGGQVAGREDVLRDVVLGGNELGNHAMKDEAARSLPLDVLARELSEVEGYINQTYAAVGKQRGDETGRYFRPGSGAFSSGMRNLVARLGFSLVLGSVYPYDAQVPYAWVNARHVLSMVRPGSIIICHDRRSWTVGMLEIVLPQLRRRGYVITTVSGLLAARREEGVT